MTSSPPTTDWNLHRRKEENHCKQCPKADPEDCIDDGNKSCWGIKEHKGGCIASILALTQVTDKCNWSCLHTESQPETWLKWVQIICFLQITVFLSSCSLTTFSATCLERNVRDGTIVIQTFGGQKTASWERNIPAHLSSLEATSPEADFTA